MAVPPVLTPEGRRQFDDQLVVVVQAAVASERADSSPDLDVLDPTERDRASRFRRPEDRSLYVRAHALLRTEIARITGEKDVVLGRRPCPCCGGPHGRPYLEQPAVGLELSLSHGAGVVCVALGFTGPLGVDVEALPPPRAARHAPVGELHPDEQADLAAVPEPTRAAAFTRLWTRKEAYLKALGTGLGRPLAADYLGSQRPEAWPRGWRFVELDVGPAHAATVCVTQATAEVEVRQAS